MALEKLKLILNPSGTTREYLIYPIENVKKNQEKPSMSIALPGQAFYENIMMGLSGQTAELSIDFKIWNDGTDRANGTAPLGVFTNDTVITLEDQITYIEEYMHDPSFSCTWKLDHITGDRFDNREVFFGKFDTPILSRESPKWLNVRMDLTVGKSI